MRWPPHTEPFTDLDKADKAARAPKSQPEPRKTYSQRNPGTVGLVVSHHNNQPEHDRQEAARGDPAATQRASTAPKPATPERGERQSSHAGAACGVWSASMNET